MSNVAADQLLAEHAPALRNFLGARCRDDDLTAELLQEVAARLVTATPRLSLNGNARGYLFRIAANVWRDHLRREIVRRRTLEALQDEPRAAALPAHPGGVQPGPEGGGRGPPLALPPPHRQRVPPRPQPRPPFPGTAR